MVSEVAVGDRWLRGKVGKLGRRTERQRGLAAVAEDDEVRGGGKGEGGMRGDEKDNMYKYVRYIDDVYGKTYDITVRLAFEY